MSHKVERIHSQIWDEEAESDNPFAATASYCSGYDVYGDLLGKVTWVEYLYLLFRLELPSEAHAQILEGLAVALANPGPRDHSVRAAMAGGAGSSASAGCLMAALGVGAGQLGGGRDVFLAMELWRTCGRDPAVWDANLRHRPTEPRMLPWRPMEHPPGFDPHGAGCPVPVRLTLEYLASLSAGGALPWLNARREELESSAGCPLAMSGVAAAALSDLGFSSEEGEMVYLLLRLPGAAAHALEQRRNGWRRFPRFGAAVQLRNDPGRKGI